jgi:hypothetical protein
MKKIILSLVLVNAFAINDINATDDKKEQTKKVLKADDGGDKCFDETSHILNLGIGFGNNYYSIYRGTGYKYSVSPAFSLTYEQAIPKKLGPGYLGVGAYVGYQSARSRYDYGNYYGAYYGNYYYEHKWKNYMIAARGAYHLDFLNSAKAEVYAGVLIGLRIQTYTYTSNDPDPSYNSYHKLDNGSVVPAYSLFAGARWYFAKNIAVYGELGYGISYATVGLSFRL